MGTLKVDTIQDSGGNTILSSDGSGGFSNSLPAGKSGSFRNIIINGDMSIAQRATSQAGISTGYNTCDRWRSQQQIGAFTQSQSTDVPSGQGFAKSLKMDCTTADASPASNGQLAIQQRLEGQMLQYIKKGTSNAESLTMSFWVKSNKTGTYTAEIFDEDNTRQITRTYTIDSSNTWEKKTLTFVGDTTGTLDNDNARSFEVLWWLGTGSDKTSGTYTDGVWQANVNANRLPSSQVNLADSTSNDFYITGVQLEAGTTASDFEFLPVDVNMQRCLRYYELLAQGNGITFGNTTYYSSTVIYSSQKTTVPMRSTPSLDYVSGSSYYRAIANSANDYFNEMLLGDASNKTFEIYSSSGISGTAGHSAFLRTANASAFVAIDSEL
jgi:hypothetical protein